MERSVRVRFCEPKFVYDGRYIHKYYLPQELRYKIFPVDIDGISSCFGGNNEYHVRDELIPDKVPDCVIQYKDIGLEKRIDKEAVCQVLLAMADYHADTNGELTPEENQAAMNLNAWLIDWEKDLLARCIQLSNDMERQVRSGEGWLTDYEIDVDADFYVRDDDPYHLDNIPESFNNDLDSDSSLLCTLKYLAHFPVQNTGSPEYRGIGDNQDHNDLRELEGEGIQSVRHCQTFHELFSHINIPIKLAGRIGRVYSDIIVRHQNVVNVDLRGKKAIVAPDLPIREEIALCDDVTQKPVNS